MADNQDTIDLKRRARRRLVGAIALVVLVVIVLPILLDSEPKPISQDLTIQIPGIDSGQSPIRELPPPLPLGAGTPTPGSYAQDKAEPEIDGKAASVKSPTAGNGASPRNATAVSKEPVKSLEAAVISHSAPDKMADDRGFIVPLGMFSQSDNVKQVRSKATKAGFKTYTESSKDGTRVRAGPFSSREAADKAHDKLKNAGLDVGAVAPR